MSYSLCQMINYKKKYAKRKAMGICVQCDNPAEPNRIRCKECSEKDRISSAKRNKKKRELGVRILRKHNK